MVYGSGEATMLQRRFMNEREILFCKHFRAASWRALIQLPNKSLLPLWRHLQIVLLVLLFYSWVDTTLLPNCESYSIFDQHLLTYGARILVDARGSGFVPHMPCNILGLREAPPQCKGTVCTYVRMNGSWPKKRYHNSWWPKSKVIKELEMVVKHSVTTLWILFGMMWQFILPASWLSL